MKNIYAVTNAEELLEYQTFARKIQPELLAYIRFLEKEYAVKELPRAIVWTSRETATGLISDIPVPAYTNAFRIVISPSLEVWRDIYLKQLDSFSDKEEVETSVRAIRKYYKNRLSHNNILQILGHELAHHSELFLEDFSSVTSNGVWFEEGMAEYISRRYFLSSSEFEAELQCNQQLVSLDAQFYGTPSLESFGTSTYAMDYNRIFFEYWRSFLAVMQIIENHNGDVHSVFRSYHEWNAINSGQTLEEWFGI